jgi:para-aminobenzoate synthetase
MKGTVRKSAAVSTLAQAEEILHVPKEEAENLMIVDLVRHDLYGVCGAQSVTVPDLLRVEEYASVFQMVTAVNGQLPAEKLEAGTDPTRGEFPFTGMDVLASCLPPGSMTGAPKKRSCEILQTIEPTERSVYSGVIGYLDVQGKGDWSVTIRTMFRWDDEKASPRGDETEPREVWRIGAGGAVTTLSTPEGEREEMFTKLCGPLGTFSDFA